MITEVFEPGPVRLLGRQKSYDADYDRLIIVFNGREAFVDTQYLDPLPYSNMSQIEVFGVLSWEIENGAKIPLIEAKILNCINEVDLNLYMRVIPILEKHRKKLL